jgi:hypothetical protein
MNYNSVSPYDTQQMSRERQAEGYNSFDEVDLFDSPTKKTEMSPIEN